MVPHDRLPAGLRDGAWLDSQQFPPLRYHVPRLVPEGLCVLAGAPKVGKSWLVLDLLLAVAGGGLALGAVPAAPGDVLYLALEDGDRRMQARCRALLGRAPIPARFGYVTEVLPGQLAGNLAGWLELHPAGFVVVDTLGRVLPPASTGETSYSRDYRIMSELKAVADAFPGAALLMNHHDRKLLSADFVDSVSGTNGIAGAADTVLVLTRPREEAAGLLQITGRDVTEGAYALTFSQGTWAWTVAAWTRPPRRRHSGGPLPGWATGRRTSPSWWPRTRTASRPPRSPPRSAWTGTWPASTCAGSPTRAA